MTRPKKNTVDYFSHDCVHSGKTLYILEERYQNDGYCFWFKLLEKLGSTEGHFLDLNEEIELEFLCSRIRCTKERLKEMLDLCSKLGAIDDELWGQKVVWCQNFVDRISEVYTRNRHIEPPARPHNYAEKPHARVVTTQSNPQSKVKESKGKEYMSFSEKFNLLWTAYPPKGRGRSGKKEAEAEWNKMTEAEKDKALVALEIYKAKEDWRKEGGKYVMAIHRWLKKGCYNSVEESDREEPDYKAEIQEIGSFKFKAKYGTELFTKYEKYSND